MWFGVSRDFLGVKNSATGKRWVSVDSDVREEARNISRSYAIPEIVGCVLASRGVSCEQAEDYLSPKIKSFLPDPKVLTDIDKAVERFSQAILENEKIAIFGDYDVDGAASSALIIRWMKLLGREASLYIPDRFVEGYGPNVDAMASLAKDHSLIITLDCGTLAFEPIAKAKSLNTDVIVIDHHLSSENLPECIAVVNPNRHDDNSSLGYLCAAGVVFLFLIALNRHMRETGDFKYLKAQEPDLIGMLDIVALATIADVVPLEGLNRAFVRQGLKIMKKGNNVGISSLARSARSRLDVLNEYHMGYILGPRINALGRVKPDSANWGAKLLATNSIDEAQFIAESMEICNQERKHIEQQIFDLAIDQLESNLSNKDAKDDSSTKTSKARIIYAYGDGWHQGVSGVVASRLIEKYKMPSLVISFSEDGTGKASGRSFLGFDLGSAISTCLAEGLIIKGGGHKAAVGFSLTKDQLPLFYNRLNSLFLEYIEYGSSALDYQEAAKIFYLDGLISPEGLTYELLESLVSIGPYGMSFPLPNFAVSDAVIEFVKVFGNKHMRIGISGSSSVDGRKGKIVEAVAFRCKDTPLGNALVKSKGKKVHIAGSLEDNYFKSGKDVRFLIKDIAFTD